MSIYEKNIGKRVRSLSHRNYGKEGTIINFNTNDDEYLIEFDDYIDGHDGGHGILGKVGCCWWEYVKDCEIIEENKMVRIKWNKPKIIKESQQEKISFIKTGEEILYNEFDIEVLNDNFIDWVYIKNERDPGIDMIIRVIEYNRRGEGIKIIYDEEINLIDFDGDDDNLTNLEKLIFIKKRNETFVTRSDKIIKLKELSEPIEPEKYKIRWWKNGKIEKSNESLNNSDIKNHDYVVCIDNRDRKQLIKGKIYEVELCLVSSYNGEVLFFSIDKFFYMKKRFRKATPEEIKQYLKHKEEMYLKHKHVDPYNEEEW